MTKTITIEEWVGGERRTREVRIADRRRAITAKEFSLELVLGRGRLVWSRIQRRKQRA